MSDAFKKMQKLQRDIFENRRPVVLEWSSMFNSYVNK